MTHSELVAALFNLMLQADKHGLNMGTAWHDAEQLLIETIGE